jgi:hypothetical protein
MGETEPLAKGQKFDSLDEVIQYLEDWGHHRLPDPNMSAVELERLWLFNTRRMSRGTAF